MSKSSLTLGTSLLLQKKIVLCWAKVWIDAGYKLSMEHISYAQITKTTRSYNFQIKMIVYSTTFNVIIRCKTSGRFGCLLRIGIGPCIGRGMLYRLQENQ